MSKLDATVGINHTPFQQGLDGMRAQAKAWTGDLTKMIGGAFAFGAVASFFNSFRSEMDRIGKLSTRLGESTDTIQRLGEASSLAGTDMESVIKTLSKLTLEAGHSAEKFAAAGISAQQFLNLDTEGKLLAISAAWQAANGSADKQLAIMSLLGARGQEMLPLIQQGPDALKASLEAAAVVNERVIRGIEALNDRITQFGNSAKASFGSLIGLAQQAFIAIDEITKRPPKINWWKGLASAENRDAFKEAYQRTMDRISESDPANKPPAPKPEDLSSLGPTKEEQAAAAKLAAEMQRLEDRLAQRRLERLGTEEQILELQRRQAEAQAQAAAAATNEDKLKSANKLLDIEKQLEAAQAKKAAEETRAAGEISSLEKRAAEIQDAQRLAALAPAERLAELERRRKESFDASAVAAEEGDRKTAAEKQIEGLNLNPEIDRLRRDLEEETEEQSVKPGGIVASSLGAVGGGGGAYVGTADPSVRELQTQTGLLRQIASSLGGSGLRAAPPLSRDTLF